MATYNRILAWRIPGTEEPVGLPSMRSHRVGHGSHDLAVAVRFSFPWVRLLKLGHCIGSLGKSRRSDFCKSGKILVTNILTRNVYIPVPVQSLSRVRLFATPQTTARQASLSTTNSWSSPKPMSIESVMPSNHLILCHPLLLPSIFLSIRVCSTESALCIRWPKYWSFSFSISPSNEYSGMIFFRMDWLDILAVQGTLKSLLQHHSSKASILWHSAFFIVQFSHPYITTGKTKTLTRQTFVDKVMSLLFNMLSRFIIAFLQRSKHLLISWLQSPPAVILEPQKIKSDTVSTVSPSISHEVMGPDAMIFAF